MYAHATGRDLGEAVENVGRQLDAIGFRAVRVQSGIDGLGRTCTA